MSKAFSMHRVCTGSDCESLFEHSLESVCELDLHGKILSVNKVFEKTFANRAPDLTDTSFLDLVASDDKALASRALEQATLGTANKLELNSTGQNGKLPRLRVTWVPKHVQGRIEGCFVVVEDISADVYARDLLVNQNRVLELISTRVPTADVLQALTKLVKYHAPEAMSNAWLLEDDEMTLRHAVGHEKLRAYSAEIGQVKIGPAGGARGSAPLLDTVVVVEDISADNRYEPYQEICKKYGVRACCTAPMRSNHDRVYGVFTLCFDTVRRPTDDELELLEIVAHLAGMAAERDRYHVDLAYLAHHDSLTGLPNRTLFLERLETAFRHSRVENYALAVLFLDLDRFKTINDSMGHHVGDKVLQGVADRLTYRLDATHLLSRMGGDEFALLIPRVDSIDEAVSLARRVIGSFHTPIEVDGNSFRVTTSVGIAVSPDGDSPEALMRNADTAMYNAKSNGKNTFSIYTTAMNQTSYQDLMTENELRRAVDNDELCLYYQPRVAADTASIVSSEALLRWHKPGAGMVEPDEFISIAEESGLIVSIGNWVFHAVCRQIVKWETMGRNPLRISVNVSPRQFQAPNFVDMIRAALQSTGADARYLEIEVTETALMKNEAKALDSLNELKAMGIHLSIDDFGLGYSSLSRLKDMPVDTLKIDRWFLQQGCNDDAVIHTIITLAHNLRLSVVAEGVETEEQYASLRRQGCDELQGFLFSKPIAADKLERTYM